MALSCGKVSARLQPATAVHARLVLSKTVLFFLHKPVQGRRDWKPMGEVLHLCNFREDEIFFDRIQVFLHPVVFVKPLRSHHARNPLLKPPRETLAIVALKFSPRNNALNAEKISCGVPTTGISYKMGIWGKG